MKFKTVAVGSYMANCYIIPDTDSVMLIDPGAQRDVIERALDGKKVALIVLTHAHFDHVEESPYFASKYKAPIYIGKDDVRELERRRDGLKYDISRTLCDGDEFSFGEMKFRVIATPGHTPGGICLHCGNDLFSGDTLFYDTIGRTDFPHSDPVVMGKSLHRLMKLDDNTLVHPGHGGDTTIGNERKYNYYVKMYTEEENEKDI